MNTSSSQPSVQGKAIIVTGGSRGLGAAIAQVLGEDGAQLVIADIALERAQDRVAALADAGIKALAMALDVGVEEDVHRVVTATREKFGRLDAVINNAAIDITVPIGELSTTDWERIVQTNLTGPFVNIASTAAKRAWPNASAYHATKWGLLGLSHALHAELRPLGIKVTAVVAGGMRTPFLLDRFPDIDPGVLQDPLNVARAVRFVLTQPEETVVPELTVLPMRETSWP
jgi:NAD(P)-dependent dehydrogenase (short-subunit alcohol dehydrogenase family)